MTYETPEIVAFCIVLGIQFGIIYLTILISSILFLHKEMALGLTRLSSGNPRYTLSKIFALKQITVVTLIIMLAHNALISIGI